VAGIELAAGGPNGPTDSCSRRYQIHCEGSVIFDADAILLALPAHESSRLISTLDPASGELLGGIPYSSSVTVSLGFGAGAREQLPPGFGYLVPWREHRRMLACTFVHRKFNHRAPENMALLRCFLGGSRDPGVLELADADVIATVRRELREILDFRREPLFCRIHRWPSSMAQYIIGHAERIRRIQERLTELPGLHLAGNAYSGIGISDCIRTGEAAAHQALEAAGVRLETQQR
jgi:oxygen-dependent protoporphyrinogen oxidase